MTGSDDPTLGDRIPADTDAMIAKLRSEAHDPECKACAVSRGKVVRWTPLLPGLREVATALLCTAIILCGVLAAVRLATGR